VKKCELRAELTRLADLVETQRPKWVQFADGYQHLHAGGEILLVLPLNSCDAIGKNNTVHRMPDRFAESLGRDGHGDHL